MKRKLRGETVAPVPHDDDAYDDLRRQCAKFAEDNLDILRTDVPQVPSILNDRAADKWRPLAAIAELCGDEWALKARDAAVALSGVEDDDEPGILLLTDLRRMFERKQAARGNNLLATPATSINLATKDIV